VETDWEPLTPANPAAPAPRVCRRHEWAWAGMTPEEGEKCRRCGRLRDVLVSRRARNNRSRGNSIERSVAASLGMRRVGQYGGPDDARGSLFNAQVKSGKSYPERLHRWLKAVPVAAGQVAILVITDAPGPGHGRRRGLVVLDLDDWRDLHGETLP
jgi:hypothetical protein